MPSVLMSSEMSPEDKGMALQVSCPRSTDVMQRSFSRVRYMSEPC